MDSLIKLVTAKAGIFCSGFKVTAGQMAANMLPLVKIGALLQSNKEVNQNTAQRASKPIKNVLGKT